MHLAAFNAFYEQCISLRAMHPASLQGSSDERGAFSAAPLLVEAALQSRAALLCLSCTPVIPSWAEMCSMKRGGDSCSSLILTHLGVQSSGCHAAASPPAHPSRLLQAAGWLEAAGSHASRLTLSVSKTVCGLAPSRDFKRKRPGFGVTSPALPFHQGALGQGCFSLLRFFKGSTSKPALGFLCFFKIMTMALLNHRNLFSFCFFLFFLSLCWDFLKIIFSFDKGKWLLGKRNFFYNISLVFCLSKQWKRSTKENASRWMNCFPILFFLLLFLM